MQKILTTQNDKTIKSVGYGYLTFGIHFAHAKLSGFNVCSDSSAGCEQSCLDFAGRGQQNSIKKARIKKTKDFFADIPAFMLRLCDEITAAEKQAKKKGLTPCFRLNLTSDVKWERILLNGKNIFQIFPHLSFYDYTKTFSRLSLGIPNYHLTFSRSETPLNHLQSELALKANHNVAIVFSTKKADELPQEYQGKRVIDGDKNDIRFLDPQGVVVGLRAKGPARQDDTGFVVHV